MALVVEELGLAAPEIVAGRYRIEGRIAKGGMGAVYRAFDQAQNRQVALKRLRVEGDPRPRARMFEREFHTLAGLKHPRIIEVYDYGIDEQGAFYTMELLDGRDLRELAPLSYKTACLYLRDVASSLALLHARNLLHRDLSSRNVRITASGRAKLIDFGALADFGRSSNVVGTAPLVPPEGLYGGVLDQRADLYSLGALAYWVLTGRHAYDVQTLDELPAAWEKPLSPPSQLVPVDEGTPKIPAALDHLVLSLLSRNPLARPASAAEVIARLSTIAELAPDEEPLSVLSYLHGGRPVGRARERAQLRKSLKAALAGHGSVVVIEAEAGMGVARILGDLATEARLSGTVAIVVDASLHRGAYAVVEEIARALLATHPDKARGAMGEDEAVLARFIPGSEGRVSTRRFGVISTERPSVDPRESRMRMQAALLSWLERLTEQVPLLLAVHNFQRADDNSAALLSGLARGIGTRRMLIALAYNADEPQIASAVHASLHESAMHMRLHGLDRDEVRALVEATFGETQHSERLAAWLHGLTSGKPQGCLDLMQHLVEQGVIRFIEGVWALPQELSAHDLPSDLGQALDARIMRLSDEARRLALALSVHRGAVPLERCLAIAALEQIAEPRKALAELEQRGVLVEGEKSVRFSHGSLHDAVLRRIAPDEHERLHAQLGALLAQQDESDVEAMLDAGWHLLHGGQERRGADLLADAGADLSLDADGLPAAIPALRAALEAFRKQGRGKHELARLLTPLATAGFFVDRSVIETYGEEAAALMQDVLGLNLAKRLRPWLGMWLASRVGLGLGVVRFAFVVGPRKALAALKESVQLFVQLALALTGLGTVTLDAPRARRAAKLLEPLAGLGPNHAASLISEFANALAMLPEDRVAQTLAALRKVLQRVERSRPSAELPESARTIVLGTVQYAIGALEGFRENPQVLEIATRLEGMGLKIFELFGNQIRGNYHGLRGEVGLCDKYRQRVDMIAVQAGSGWQAQVWAPTSEIVFYIRTGDVVGIRRVMGQLERLSKEIPSLRRYAQLAQAAYCTLRGDQAAGLEVGAAILSASEPRGFIGWGTAVAAKMGDLTALGEAEQARLLGLRALALLDADDRTVSIMVSPLVVAVAWAEATLGDVASAAARIDGYLAELADYTGSTTRGILHETRARIAHKAHDIIVARHHLAQVERCFRSSDNPALIARYERLRREIDVDAPQPEGALRDTLDLGLPSMEHVLGLLRRCEGHQQRFDRTLELLLEHTGSASGYLFSVDEGEPTWVSPRGRDEPAAGLVERVRAAIASHARGSEQTASTRTRSDAGSDAATLVQGQDRHRVFVLSWDRKGEITVVGAAAITVGRRLLRAPPSDLLSALAEGLAEPVSV
jgi:hypothetical protein